MSSATAKFWRMKHPIKFPSLPTRVFLCPMLRVKHAHKGTKTARYHQNFFKVSSFLTLIAVFCGISPRFLLKISPSYFLLHFSFSCRKTAQCKKKILYSKCKGGYQLMLTYQVLGKSPLFAPSFSGVCKMFLFWHFWGIFLCGLEVFSYLCRAEKNSTPERTSLTLFCS